MASKKKSASKSKKAKKESQASGNGQSEDPVEEVKASPEEKLERKKEKKEKKKHKTSVEFESPIQREEAVAYFETLVAGLKKGNIHLKQDGEELSLTPPAQLEVKVKASRKKEKEKISFQIEWRTAASSELMISSE